MHPSSFNFLARQIGLLLASIVLALIAQQVEPHGVITCFASICFVVGTARVARHVVNVNRRHRNFGYLSIIGVLCLAVVFAALFLSNSIAFAPFLLLVLIPFIYFAITN